MPKEEMEKYRILASEQRVVSAERWLDAGLPYANWDDVRRFVFSFCLPDRQGGGFSWLLAKFREYEDEGFRPGQIRGLKDVLGEEMAKKWNVRDDLSVVGASVPPDTETNTLPWSSLSSEHKLGPFIQDEWGGFLTLVGLQRTGKTGIACHYFTEWHKMFPKALVLTNVALDFRKAARPDWIRISSSASDLLLGIADAIERKTRWLWCYDDAGTAGWLRSDAGRSAIKGKDKLARIVPKFRGSLLYIEHREMGVDTTVTDFAKSHIYAERKGFALTDLPGGHIAVRSIPKPEMEYHSEMPAGFRDDIDWDAFLAHIRFDGGTFHLTRDLAEKVRKFVAQANHPKADARVTVKCTNCNHTWRAMKIHPRRCPKCQHYWPAGEEPSPANEVKSENGKNPETAAIAIPVQKG